MRQSEYFIVILGSEKLKSLDRKSVSLKKLNFEFQNDFTLTKDS